MNKRKLLLIGWDAADWQLIRPLLQVGKMPSLKRLMDQGVHGNLSTLNPPFSPMLWTSIATGKTPDKHGVMGFIELDAEAQLVRPVTVSQRRVRALWNIFHHQGLRSNLVGWWPSHPAEPIRGAIVTDKYAMPTAKYDEPWKHVPNSIHPEELAEEIDSFRVHPAEITPAHIVPFFPKVVDTKIKDFKGIEIFDQIMGRTSSFHAASTYLAMETEWDFMAVYHDYIDHMCHAFMKFHPPKLPQIPQENFDLNKNAVDGAYMFQDMMLGRMLDIIDENTTVMVISDHGYVSDSNRMLKHPDVQAAPALDHREFGMIVAAGPGIKKGEQLYGASILDITPTILHYYGMPVGEDMEGRVLTDMFEDPGEVKTIPSWEDVEGDFGTHDHAIQADPLSDQEAMEQLIELGYVERPSEDVAATMKSIKLHLKHNLARVHIGKKETDRAIEILKELVEQEGGDRQLFYVDLIQLMLEQKEFKQARFYLNELKKTNAKNSVRLRLMEAQICIGEKEAAQAMKLLKSIPNHPGITGAIFFEMGKIYLSFGDHEAAEEHFRKALVLNPDRAKYHHGLAKVLLQKRDYESALDSALQAIELVRYFPDAHYTIGAILEALGEHEQAQAAYAFANKLDPSMARPKHARERLQSQMQGKKSVASDSDFPEIVLVSGLPRSGTSMMMQMLHAGGLPVLTDGIREKDTNNPKGYYEYEKVKALQKDNSWLTEAEGKAIKIIAQLLKHLPPDFRYKIIFMQRDLDEVLASQRTMLKRNLQMVDTSVRDSFERELDKIYPWAEMEPNVDILYVPYAEVVDQPATQIKRIVEFLDCPMDADAMQQQIESGLYRNRRLSL